MPDFKLLPMGISDFRRIRRENYYYVDKTEWIPQPEAATTRRGVVRLDIEH